MPYKHNESRRHKIEKAKYRVTNWPKYNHALRERGNFTVYFTEEAIDQWHSTKEGKRGRPQKYSPIAIKISLMIRQVFHLPLRQTQDFMNGLVAAMEIKITIPDFSSLSIPFLYVWKLPLVNGQLNYFLPDARLGIYAY